MFFTLSKILGPLTNPAVILAILILAGLLALWMRRWRAAVYLQAAAAAIVILFGILPGATWLALPLETRFPANPNLPAHVAGIIVLGGSERVDASGTWGQPLLSDPTPLATLVALARRFSDAKLVFSGGGSWPNTTLKEADVVSAFLTEIGFDAKRVIYERRSRNTYQNGLFSYQLIKPKPGERWILVTQAIAMPRAVGVFRHMGWNVIPYPAGYLTARRHPGLFSLNIGGGLQLAAFATHEWIGLIAYRLVGYTDQIFPR